MARRARRIRDVLDHELAHVRRRDHWIAWLELAAAVVWWWNPVLWFIRRQLRETREMACDALALADAADARHEYARLLLEMTTGQSFVVRPAPMFGAGPVSKASLQRRLAMLFNEHVTPRVSVRGLAAAALLATVLALILRLNIPAAVVGTFLANPLTVVPMFVFAYWLGCFVLMLPPDPIHFEMSWHWLTTEFVPIWKPFLLGCFLMGLIAGVAGYIVLGGLWHLTLVARYRRSRL